MLNSRRSFLVGVGAAIIGSPAIVRAASLMPVSAFADRWMYEAVVLGYQITYNEMDMLLIKNWGRYSFSWQEYNAPLFPPPNGDRTVIPPLS